MPSEILRSLRRKLKKAHEEGDLEKISESCCDLASCLSDSEEHEEALALYKESLTCCEKLKNKEAAALANRMIAEECINLGYFEEALKYVSDFLKYAQDEGDKVEEQRGYVLKGHVYFTHAEYLMDAKPNETKKVEQLLEQSMEAYRKSFAICNSKLINVNERHKLQMKARLFQNKSLVLSRQNKLDFAKELLIRAIKICVKEKLNDTQHICYLSLGELYLKKNEPEEALSVYDKAFELSYSTQKKRDSLVGKAKTYIMMEKYELAKTTLKNAYRVKSDEEVKRLLRNVANVIELDHLLCSTPDSQQHTRQNIYKKLGDSYCSLKCYKKGIKCYLNMLGSAQKAEQNKNEVIKCYSLLCKAFTSDKQYDKALFYSHQEVECLLKFAPETTCKTYLRIAKLYELNGSEFEEIHFAYSKAKCTALQYKNVNIQKKCLKKLIKIGQAFDKPNLMLESEKELQELKNEENDSASSCDSGNDSESDGSRDSEENNEPSSDFDYNTLFDSEDEDYVRPKDRYKKPKLTVKRNEKGETDLHVAAIKGNYKRVQQLINQGHPVNVRDTAGWTPLHEACNHGYVDIVNILLDFGANINDSGGPSCDGTTPLHDAAINGQLEVLDTLIKRGASTLVLNKACETPLQCLLAWKNNSALDETEDEMFETIAEALKSPLDSKDIKRRIKAYRKDDENKWVRERPTETSSNVCMSVSTEKKSKHKEPSAVLEYKETIELLRGKRQAHRQDSRGSGSESSEDDCSFGNVRKKPKSACEEYKEAIEELRFKRKSNTPCCTVKTQPIPALISEHEYVENCIMDNDEEEELEADKLTKDDFHIEENNKISEGINSSPFIMKKPSLEEEIKAKPWLKSIPMDLLEDSFELPTKQKEDDDDACRALSETASEMEVSSSGKYSKSTESLSEPTSNITINIFNDKLKISVSQSEIDKLKLIYVIQEIWRKYPTLHNPDNLIYFKAQDVILWDSDSLSQVGNAEIDCIVTKWKSLPLSERYEKICATTSHPDIPPEVRTFGFKHTVHPQVAEIFKKSSQTRNLALSKLKLSSLTLIPICKAIKYESFIHKLDLSNNYFGDKGLELIVKIFEKCIIEELNISGCNITLTGVYHLSDALKSMNDLSKNGLEVLNLSSNPITDDAIAAIYRIIEQLPNLRTLIIDRCEMETSISINNSTTLTVIQDNEFESPHGVTKMDSCS